MTCIRKRDIPLSAFSPFIERSVAERESTRWTSLRERTERETQGVRREKMIIVIMIISNREEIRGHKSFLLMRQSESLEEERGG